MFDLTGRVALVTGGSMGLGLTFSDPLAAAGADVALTARSTDLLEENEAGLRERPPPGLVPNDFEQWKHGIPGLHFPLPDAPAEG